MSDIPEWPPEDTEAVIPFITVVSNGGPHEDEPFLAGYQVGTIDGTLRPRIVAAMTCLIYSNLKLQVDLIAMNHGYTCDLLAENEVLAHIGFTRIEREED